MRDAMVAICLVSLGTYALRASMIVRVDPTPLPDLVRRGLNHLSPAVLAALVLPALLVGPDGTVDVALAPIAAGAAAVMVARRNSSIPLVLAAGLLSHELARWLL